MNSVWSLDENIRRARFADRQAQEAMLTLLTNDHDVVEFDKDGPIPEPAGASDRSEHLLDRPSMGTGFHWRRILAEVAKRYCIDMAELLSARRSRRLVLARHEAAYRMRYETTFSFPQIGLKLGGRHHTSILHGCRVHAQRLKGMNG